MSVIKPKALKPGDVIRLVTPASPIPAERLQFMTNLLESEGYQVQLGDHALDSDAYLAGSDQDRAGDLMDAFDDPKVSAVLCTRGGYGCARLWPLLDFDRMAASGKMFLGFSDITTLHLALNRRGLVTMHAPMSLTFHFERQPWVYESFRRALRGGDPFVAEAPRATTLTPGKARGRTVGGCMCLLTDSLATADALDTEGRILLIEDVDEAPHRVDAMLTHLRNLGLLQKAAGIAIGEMTGTDDKTDAGIGGRSWREIVMDRVGDLGVPTVTGFPFGHMKTMLTVPLNVYAELDADAGTLNLLESACA
jgi:muramoyltetrapeptide carboxypeptidase